LSRKFKIYLLKNVVYETEEIIKLLPKQTYILQKM